MTSLVKTCQTRKTVVDYEHIISKLEAFINKSLLYKCNFTTLFKRTYIVLNFNEYHGQCILKYSIAIICSWKNIAVHIEKSELKKYRFHVFMLSHYIVHKFKNFVCWFLSLLRLSYASLNHCKSLQIGICRSENKWPMISVHQEC